MPDLHDWLTRFGLEALNDILVEHDIDLDILPDLAEADFEKLGISLGQRRRLMKAVASLAETPPPEITKLARSAEAPSPPTSAPTGAAKPAPEAERRQVTVLFCDLVGSTALATELDPEDLSRLIRRYQDACAGAIARFDGYVAKFMGDGLLAYFGYPQAREDAAERSVRAGLAIVAAVRQITRPGGLPLESRVGIATGLVVIGDIVGTGAAREESIVGETPNLAARLQTLAEPNTVLVSESTFRLLGRAFEYESRGEHALKGFARPLQVWLVVREASVASRFAAARPAALSPFVGREQEMGLLLDRWRLAEQGEGQAILLTAEPGMGKSRLTEALFERLAGRPHLRIVTQCSPYYSNTAFYPVMRQIELAAGFVMGATDSQRLDKLEALLARAGTPILPSAPLIADLLSLPTDKRYPALDLTQAQRKNATVTALVDHVLRLAERQPVLFVLEDAHWLDPSTQEMMTRLIDSIGSGRVLVIVTARPEFASPWTGRDHVVSLALGRLGKAQCAEIIAGIATHAVGGDLADEILARTDGVPLFVEELTRTIDESQIPNRLEVPSTLQDSLMARLDRLGSAKEIAQIAAAIGRQFAHALLAAVAPVGTGELDSALARLTEASLVFPHARAIEPTYSFKHALTRDVAYDSLLRARRQELHERIARTLERDFPALAEAEPEILAYHFSRADLPGPACLYSERAGDRAVARSAYAEAFAHFEAALAEGTRLPPGNERDRRELAVLLKRGPVAIVFKGHRSPEVERTYTRAHNLAQSLGDEHALFRAVWGLWFFANLGQRTDLARDHANELVALAQRSGDDALFLEALHCRWSTAFFRGDVAKTLADAREGIAHYDSERHRRLASEFGGHDAGVCAYSVAGMALMQLGRPRAAAVDLEQGIALAERLGQPSSLVHATMNATQGYQILGNSKAVLDTAARMAAVAEKYNLPLQRSLAAFFTGCAIARSDLEKGLPIIEAEFPRIVSTAPLPQLYAAQLASVCLDLGQTTRALALLDPLFPSFKEPGVGFYLSELHRLRGECLLRLEPPRFDDAVSEFEAAIAVAKQQQALSFQLSAALSLARACRAKGLRGRGLGPLRDLVEQFGDGDDTPDLGPARELLAMAES